jgi:CRP-like cAMP-binding protein
MEKLLDEIQNIYPISKGSFALLSSKIEVISLNKKDLLIKDGTINRYVYFIKKGAVRSFYYKDGREITLWFGFEGNIAVSLNNFINQKPSSEIIELLEDTSFYRISLTNLLHLYKSNIEIANWGRRLAEFALLEMEEQILSIQFQEAKSRYLNLLNKFPHILQRVQLGYIASYLGISQVTLSRLRANK